ncbi:MAG TPA: hypothetical protein VFK05_22195 [Polyangiaceae bacterium]|nr:hypothetical protein [Polyangiaceae bacterium]
MQQTRRLGWRATLSGLALTGLVSCGSSEPNGFAAAGAGAEAGGSSSGAGGQLNVILSAAGAGGLACERQVTLQAVKLGEPAPFDLVIVADHSASLAWSRDELVKGLQSLLTNVQGRQVRVFLLTPTQYGASSAPAKRPLTGDAVVAWQDPTSGKAYEPAMTDYSQTCVDPMGATIDCPDPKGKVPYKVHGTWSFAMPKPIATLLPDMTATAFAAEAQAVQDAILAIGGKGSPEEQPLCTLARYISQPAAQLPKNAVFLLISDEDDVSQPKDCLLSYDSELKSYRVEQGSSACSSGCDAYRYSMQVNRHWQRMPFTCAAFTDTGTRIAGTDQSSWYNTGACDTMNPGTCTSAERATIQAFCDSGLTLAECTRECASQEFPCNVDLPDASVNACTASFSYNGQTWANLAAYCAAQGSVIGACSGGGVKLQYTESVVGTYSQVNVTPGTSNTADIGAYFKTTAAKAFASGGYLLEGIVFEPSFSCTLGSGQSYATNLSSFIGDKSHLFPLCESYAPALDGVLGFAQTLIQTEFTLDLKDDEHVSDVIVVSKDNAERKLPVTAYQFDAATRTLTVDPASIRASDVNLRVEITSECRPIVR